MLILFRLALHVIKTFICWFLELQGLCWLVIICVHAFWPKEHIDTFQCSETHTGYALFLYVVVSLLIYITGCYQ